MTHPPTHHNAVKYWLPTISPRLPYLAYSPILTKKKVNPLNILHEKKKNLEKTRSTMFMIEELSK